MNVLQELRKLPPHVLIRLMVDGEILQRENGWQQYESRESGCIADFFHGLTYAMHNLQGDTLRLSDIQALNALCGNTAMKNAYVFKAGDLWENHGGWIRFKNKLEAHTAAGIQQRIAHYREHNHQRIGGLMLTHYPPQCDNERVELTAKSITTLCEKYNCTEAQLGQAIYNQFSTGRGLYQLMPDFGYAMNPAQEIINVYHTAIARASTLAEKEKIIVTLMQQLEQTHIFYDANNRTLINLLGFALFVKHGLPLFILHDYNIFDGYSVAEIIAKIHEGQDLWQRAIRGEVVHGYNSQALSENDNAQLTAMTRNFIEDDMPAVQQRLKPFWVRYYQTRLLLEIPPPSNAQLGQAIFQMVSKMPMQVTIPLYYMVYVLAYVHACLMRLGAGVRSYMPQQPAFFAPAATEANIASLPTATDAAAPTDEATTSAIALKQE